MFQASHPHPRGLVVYRLWTMLWELAHSSHVSFSFGAFRAMNQYRRIRIHSLSHMLQLYLHDTRPPSDALSMFSPFHFSTSSLTSPRKCSVLINSIWQISGCSRSNRSIPHPPIRRLLCYVAAVAGWRQDNACIIRWEGYRKVFWYCTLEPKPQVSGPASVTSEAVVSVLECLQETILRPFELCDFFGCRVCLWLCFVECFDLAVLWLADQVFEPTGAVLV